MTFHSKRTPPKPLPKHGEGLTREHLVQGVSSRIKFERNKSDIFADLLTARLGTVSFLLLNVLFFVGWISYNQVLGSRIFDPFPFEMLTTIVSLEAIFLSTIVLISQNRQSRIADIRQQMDFEIDVRSEEEISKIVSMLAKIEKHLGVKENKTGAKKIRQMVAKTNIAKLKKDIESAAE